MRDRYIGLLRYNQMERLVLLIVGSILAAMDK